MLENLAPHLNTFSLDAPGVLTKAVNISKPVLENIAAWYEDQDEPVDPDKRMKMLAIAMA